MLAISVPSGRVETAVRPGPGFSVAQDVAGLMNAPSSEQGLEAGCRTASNAFIARISRKDRCRRCAFHRPV